MSDLAHSWSGCFKVRRRVVGQGGMKWVFEIVPLSFILYFEFCVQILVQSSGLKDGSNNICPIRNQFQMSFVINRSWKFWVGRKGGYGRTTLRKEPCFSPGFILFLSSAHFRVTYWSCIALQKGELLSLWLQDVAFSTVVRSSYMSAEYNSW